MKEKIFKKVCELCIEKLGINEDEINEKSFFIDDLGCDSLDCIELLMEIEVIYEISIPDEKAEKVKTVSEAVDLIHELTQL